MDINPSAGATFTADILTWRYAKLFPPHYFDIIAAGVPCTEYSVAKTTGQRNMPVADRIVQKTLELIQYFQPPVWWIENPRYGLLKDRLFMKNIPVIDLDYCQFSDRGYQKPTRLWVSPSLSHLPNILCNPENCPNVIRGKKGTLQHRQRLGGNAMEYTTKTNRSNPQASG